MQKKLFTLGIKVRDYECDMQGVVNNANYQHYLEHARHEFLKTIGLDFARLNEEGILLVVKRIEMDYHFPLRSGDACEVSCQLERISPLRFGFVQQIIRTSDQKPIISARVIGTSINRQGRPFLPEVLDKQFQPE
ncbi:MAG: acyl-CoA thioesterase [Bacteroidetes bacterium]|nr:acyl-CoA thioesterase [Bacteroidota bacterium]MBU1578350.1 acyl-CoA thioesterase [Bacteroidota bacterium]MBU2465912.1 acyl-CoA thioesterase [Bacteroidota bacterium]MBU2557349.1 acyl-CoA thioesterase [Bacteroidota bacterium]